MDINQPDYIYEQNIKSIGLVAGFNDFYANICLSEIGFYPITPTSKGYKMFNSLKVFSFFAWF